MSADTPAEAQDVTPAEAAAPAQVEKSTVFFVSLKHRGSIYPVPVQERDCVGSILDFVQEVLNFPRETSRLIFQGKGPSKVLRPDECISDVGLVAGSKMMLVASSAHDVEHVRGMRPDPLVKGFEEEERDEKRRKKRARAAAMSAWGTKQDSEYRFRSIKAEFKYTTPTPYDAERLLERLATDPGIIDIMKTHHFQVGILTEMSPAEAQERMQQMEPGSEKDLLGYNQNSGEKIVLRLRTDNVKGFRRYSDIINTLIHELTHNVWGPHDHNFWRLFGELKAQYLKFHSFWSHGGQTADGASGDQFTGFAGDSDDEVPGSFGKLLGGGGGHPVSEEERRERAIAAMEKRVAVPPQPLEDSESSPPPLPPEPFRGGEHLEACRAAFAEPCSCGSCFPPAREVFTTCGSCEVVTADDLPGLATAPVTAEEPMEPPQDAVPVQPAQAPSELQKHDPVTPELQSTAVYVPEETVVPVAATAEADAPVDSAYTPESVAGLDLDAADLEALGLGGAAEWLSRFRARLEELWRTQPKGRAAVEVLLRLVRNIMSKPYEARFRRIRTENPKIRADLMAAGKDAEALISLLGFESAVESGEKVFVLKDAAFDSARLQMGTELLESRLQAVPVT